MEKSGGKHSQFSKTSCAISQNGEGEELSPLPLGSMYWISGIEMLLNSATGYYLHGSTLTMSSGSNLVERCSANCDQAAESNYHVPQSPFEISFPSIIYRLRKLGWHVPFGELILRKIFPKELAERPIAILDSPLQ
jgi:hypothetical protein